MYPSACPPVIPTSLPPPQPLNGLFPGDHVTAGAPTNPPGSSKVGCACNVAAPERSNHSGAIPSNRRQRLPRKKPEQTRFNALYDFTAVVLFVDKVEFIDINDHFRTVIVAVDPVLVMFGEPVEIVDADI